MTRLYRCITLYLQYTLSVNTRAAERRVIDERQECICDRVDCTKLYKETYKIHCSVFRHMLSRRHRRHLTRWLGMYFVIMKLETEWAAALTHLNRS